MAKRNKGDSFGFKKEPKHGDFVGFKKGELLPKKPKGIKGIKGIEDIEKGTQKQPKELPLIIEPPLPDISIPEPPLPDASVPEPNI
ncbi:MAG TPA: hypothetical protein VK184_10870 [Nostocaceae cyanobacterium]|nr:hypothetical protein [Nostocaceae cyanobacterium]